MTTQTTVTWMQRVLTWWELTIVPVIVDTMGTVPLVQMWTNVWGTVINVIQMQSVPTSKEVTIVRVTMGTLGTDIIAQT
jgi:hypothetical protein